MEPGTRLGHYEILSPLGAGGMGEVYRAHDTTLDRDVAIKVLPEDFAADPERLVRFHREARLRASLNHPNVATIYGFEESGGVRFIAMELVEGQSLAEQLKASGRIPVDVALEIARQIALALEAAHEAGVIHRDLKPANVQVTPDGNVKVLDFGIAKVHEPEVASDLSQSPTAMAPTATGVVMGTAHYMSPEQARGKPLDKRTDIWSFGCVLYEMMTGRTAFAGETVIDVLTAVLEREPDWTALPETTSPIIQRLLQRCLRKDPGQRLHDIADVRIELHDEQPEPAPPTDRQPRPFMIGRALVVTLGAVGLLMLGIAAWQAMRPSSGTAPVVSRLVVTVPPDQELNQIGGSYPLALSPQGDRLAYVAETQGKLSLFVRDLDDFEARAIPGSEGARYPFFSPDGEWVGFVTVGQMFKAAVAGGRPIVVSESASFGRGISWGADGHIYFIISGAPGLSRVSADGGAPEAVVSQNPEIDALRHRWPHVLPDASGVLSTVVIPADSVNQQDHRLAVLSFATGEWQELGQGTQGQVIRDDTLVYHAANGELRVVAFDLDSHRIAGSPTSVHDGVFRASGGGGAYFAVSRTGSLVYVRGGFDRSLVRVDREGRDTPLTDEVRGFRLPRVSPDGSQVAATIDPRPSQVWVLDVARGTLTKVADEGHTLFAIWTPDGQRVVFARGADLYAQSRDGTGNAELLLGAPYRQYPASFSPDGELLVFNQVHPTTGADIWAVSSEAEVFPLLETEADEYRARVSPDGSWIAYASNETGVLEVYVAAFPEMGRRQRISVAGGTDPVWARDGTELFYSNDGQLWVVPLDAGPALTAGIPEVLFDWPHGISQTFDVFPDGRSFVMVKTDPESAPDRFYVVLNWFDELTRLAPTDP